MDKAGFQDWLDRYVAAWKSYNPDDIAELFSDDIVYKYHPLDEGTIGRDEVVKDWVDNKDDEGRYDAQYEPAAIDGDTYVAKGHSDYFDENGKLRDQYFNIYLIKFDGEGRATEFIEYWIQNRDFKRRDRNDLIRKAVAGEVQPNDTPAPALA
jgi:hypothetical protein